MRDLQSSPIEQHPDPAELGSGRPPALSSASVAILVAEHYMDGWTPGVSCATTPSVHKCLCIGIRYFSSLGLVRDGAAL